MASSFCGSPVVREFQSDADLLSAYCRFRRRRKARVDAVLEGAELPPRKVGYITDAMRICNETATSYCDIVKLHDDVPEFKSEMLLMVSPSCKRDNTQFATCIVRIQLQDGQHLTISLFDGKTVLAGPTTWPQMPLAFTLFRLMIESLMCHRTNRLLYRVHNMAYADRNVVVAGDVGQPINMIKLLEIAIENNVVHEYYPLRFPGMHIGLDNVCTVLNFCSGKQIYCGIPTLDALWPVSHKLSEWTKQALSDTVASTSGARSRGRLVEFRDYNVRQMEEANRNDVVIGAISDDVKRRASSSATTASKRKRGASSSQSTSMMAELQEQLTDEALQEICGEMERVDFSDEEDNESGDDVPVARGVDIKGLRELSRRHSSKIMTLELDEVPHFGDDGHYEEPENGSDDEF